MTTNLYQLAVEHADYGGDQFEEYSDGDIKADLELCGEYFQYTPPPVRSATICAFCDALEAESERRAEVRWEARELGYDLRSDDRAWERYVSTGRF